MSALELEQSQKNQKKRVMAGMRATGALHIGHFFGALQNFIRLQQEGYSCFFGIMDWHGLTTAYKQSSSVDAWIRDMAADWLAFGLDPDKSVIFVQSRVPEHLELFMIFATLTPMGWLERVTTWKDAEEDAKREDTHNLGRFAYPVLQAADIALYKGQLVPVGQDQVAHLELSREIIRRFNRIYKGCLPEPQALHTEVPLFPGTDGRKMSKSYGNVFPLLEEPKALRKRVNSMVTDPQRVRREDPGDPEVCSVYAYHKYFSSSADLTWVVEGCRTAGIGCGECKARLAANIDAVMAEPRIRKKELLNNPDELDSIITRGCQHAREVAQETLVDVRHWMKFHGGQ
jgi:tryptophanyl-tRNA synthetase